MTERAIDIGLVEHWLDEWAHAMGAHHPVEGYVCNDSPWQDARRAVNEDYDGMVEERRMAGIVDALDACIDSLPLHRRAAIWRAYGQLAVFSFPRLDFQAVLAEAKLALGGKMRERGYPC